MLLFSVFFMDKEGNMKISRPETPSTKARYTSTKAWYACTKARYAQFHAAPDFRIRRNGRCGFPNPQARKGFPMARVNANRNYRCPVFLKLGTNFLR